MENERKIAHFEGYDVIDEGNGLSTIVVPDEPKLEKTPEPEGFWSSLFSWFRKHEVRPYAKLRDMADPTGDRRKNPDDIDVGSDGKIAGEIGIKISF